MVTAHAQLCMGIEHIVSLLLHNFSILILLPLFDGFYAGDCLADCGMR